MRRLDQFLSITCNLKYGIHKPLATSKVRNKFISPPCCNFFFWKCLQKTTHIVSTVLISSLVFSVWFFPSDVTAWVQSNRGHPSRPGRGRQGCGQRGRAPAGSAQPRPPAGVPSPLLLWIRRRYISEGHKCEPITKGRFKGEKNNTWW